MDDLDREIEKALNAEDRAMFDEFGEQGILAQVSGVFRGPQAWIFSLTTAVSVILAVGGFYSLWRLVEIGSGPDAVKWGAAAIIMLTMVSFIKVYFWLRMESNRVIREVKRLELQIARLQPNNGS